MVTLISRTREKNQWIDGEWKIDYIGGGSQM